MCSVDKMPSTDRLPTPMSYALYLNPLVMLLANFVVVVLLFVAYRTASHGGILAMLCAALLEICVSIASLIFNFVYFGPGRQHHLANELGWPIYNLFLLSGRSLAIILSAVGAILLAQDFAKMRRERGR